MVNILGEANYGKFYMVHVLSECHGELSAWPIFWVKLIFLPIRTRSEKMRDGDYLSQNDVSFLVSLI